MMHGKLRFRRNDGYLRRSSQRITRTERSILQRPGANAAAPRGSCRGTAHGFRGRRECVAPETVHMFGVEAKSALGAAAVWQSLRFPKPRVTECPVPAPC